MHNISHHITYSVRQKWFGFGIGNVVISLFQNWMRNHHETIEFYLITIIIETIRFSPSTKPYTAASGDLCNKLRDH